MGDDAEEGRKEKKVSVRSSLKYGEETLMGSSEAFDYNEFSVIQNSVKGV